MIKIDWAALLDIAAIKVQDIPKSGVPGVPGVPETSIMPKIKDLEADQEGTPERFPGVPGVPNFSFPGSLGTPGTPGLNQGVPANSLKNNEGTPGTPGTPENDRYLEKPIATPARRRPWTIDPEGERKEEDAKFFRDLVRRSHERAGLPPPEPPPIDPMTALLEAWRHEDEEAYRCWARNPYHLPDE